jgi:hypothetical protein
MNCAHLTWERASTLADNTTAASNISLIPFGWVDSEEEDPDVRHLDPTTRERLSELVQTADIVDSEFRSLRESMMDRDAPMQSWGLIRVVEGGGTGTELPGDGLQLLYTISAYSEKEAWYLVFCHASSPGLPKERLPEDYPVDCLSMIESLLGTRRRVADVLPHFVSINTGAYRIVPMQGDLFGEDMRPSVQ